MESSDLRGVTPTAAPHGTEKPASRPAAVTTAFVALIAALVFGVAETAVRSADVLLSDEAAEPRSLAIGWLTRATIYAVVLAAGWRMLRGDRWARIAITFGIGVVGLASLLVEPIAALAAGEAGAALADVDTESALVAIARIGHVCAVLVAVPAMYASAARAWFRASPKGRQPDQVAAA
ncbi:hypothetical protein [Nocardia higoensis]|uniref:hypothetical protein n=1 Tax=Nocardia higoensis TaxID=228599 RepID=UPI0002F2506F|nr:hypothetical protein [Nocardia higoensis]